MPWNPQGCCVCNFASEIQWVSGFKFQVHMKGENKNPWK